MKMEYMLFIIDIIGTIAFAFSGAMTAIRKEMDILGVMILGMVTAVGGGIIRDIILGIVPPQAFAEPVFALSAMFTSALVFVVFYFRGKGISGGIRAAVSADSDVGGYVRTGRIYCGGSKGGF